MDDKLATLCHSVGRAKNFHGRGRQIVNAILLDCLRESAETQEAAATSTTRERAAQTISCPMMRPPFKRPFFRRLRCSLGGSDGSAPNDKPNHPCSAPFPPLPRFLSPSHFPHLADRSGARRGGELSWALAPFSSAVPRNLVSELRSGGAHGRNTDVEDIRVVRTSSRMTRAC